MLASHSLVPLLISTLIWTTNAARTRRCRNSPNSTRKEMENEYQQFANQYSEMRMQISNDSIVAQLTAEQEKTERLLKELKETKTSDAREIARLKRELATVRAILRNYVIEIDSLNRLNKNLSEENLTHQGTI